MKYIYIAILVFLLTTNSNAQKNNRREKIKALKIAYITNELDLTSSEAEAFWPIFNLYDDKMYQLHVIRRKSFKKQMHDANGIDNLTEKQADELLQNMIETDFLIAKAKKQLKKNLSNVLSSKKIIKLFKAEHDFSKKLLKDFRKKHKKH